MKEKTLSPRKQAEDLTTKKVFGVPLTENVRTGVKYLGPIVAIAALQIGFGFYSEYQRTQKVHKETPNVSTQVQSTDMPVPDYRWAQPIKKTVDDLSKTSDYTGQ